MKCGMATAECSGVRFAGEFACLSNRDGGLSDYSKQKMNFQNFRFP
jgi:hypothetical protein